MGNHMLWLGVRGDGRGCGSGRKGEKDGECDFSGDVGFLGENNDPRERSRICRPGSDWNARSRVWPLRLFSDLISSSLFLCQSSSPCLVPPIPALISHPDPPPPCSHPPRHSFPHPIPFPPLRPPLHRSLPPAMYRIVAWVGRRHKGNAQQKSVVRRGTSTSQPKGESEKKKDVEATGPCHVDLGSGHVSPLNSTPRSNDEDVSTCNDDAIPGRYLLRLAPPYNRQTSFPAPLSLKFWCL
jgi:hypothetical protein